MPRHAPAPGFIQYPTAVYAVLLLLILTMITSPLFYGALNRLEAQNIHPGIFGYVFLLIACSLTSLLLFILFVCTTMLLAFSINKIAKRHHPRP
jgi:hypothetical protein